jgi:hypothetical protein
LSEELSWLERARKLVEYSQEAQEFIGRAAEQLAVSPTDAPLVGRLWLEADLLDALLATLLEEMNEELIDGQGELDTTRGVAVRPSAIAEEALYYECSWSLAWADGRGISVILSIEAGTGTLDAQVQGRTTVDRIGVRFPIREPDLKDALISAYVAEATLDTLAG